MTYKKAPALCRGLNLQLFLQATCKQRVRNSQRFVQDSQGQNLDFSCIFALYDNLELSFGEFTQVDL